MSTIPLVSQLRSLWQLVTFDTEGAKKTWNEFTEAWSRPGQQIADMADSIPVIGHIKGIVHLVKGEKDEFWKAEEGATRTLVILGAGALTVSTGGAAAPILAGVAAGLAYDGITTGIESYRHQTFDPQGYIAAGKEMTDDWRGGIFDTVAIGAGDGWVSASGVASRTTKIYRVEGESYVKSGSDITWESNRRLFADDDGHIQPSDKPGGELTYPRVKFYPRGNKSDGKVVILGLADPAKPSKNMLFLNFGERSRADAFYAQRALQYREAVEHMANLDRVPAHRCHNMRIKSFRILTRVAKDVQRRALTEAEKAEGQKAYQGVLQVDITKSSGQFGCERRIYTPILRDAIKGSYEEFTPWVEHLPPRLQRLIVDHQVAYGRVRTVVIATANVGLFFDTFVVSDFAIRLKQGTSGDVSSIAQLNIPLSQLTEEGVKNLQVCDVPVYGLRQCRHAKCGRQKQTDTDHGQHFEYLAEHVDGSQRWYPSMLVAEDLKSDFERLSMQNASDVAEVVSSDGENLTVRRINNTTDTVHQSQLFWREEESQDLEDLAEEELDGLIRHGHHGEDYEIHTPATLSFQSDWAKVETTTPATTFRMDDAFDKSIYADVTFTPTSVTFARPHSNAFHNGVVPFVIANHGIPVNIKITHGRDGYKLGDFRGRATVHIRRDAYVNQRAENETNEVSIQNCPVCVIRVSGALMYHTDWAKVETTTPGTIFHKDDAFNAEAYKDVTFTSTSVMFSKPQSHTFRNGVVPFVIVNDGRPIDIKVTHGRDADWLGDQQGRASVQIRDNLYVDNQSGGETNVKTFTNCPVLLHRTPEWTSSFATTH